MPPNKRMGKLARCLPFNRQLHRLPLHALSTAQPSLPLTSLPCPYLPAASKKKGKRSHSDFAAGHCSLHFCTLAVRTSLRVPALVCHSVPHLCTPACVFLSGARTALCR